MIRPGFRKTEPRYTRLLCTLLGCETVQLQNQGGSLPRTEVKLGKTGEPKRSAVGVSYV